MILDQFAGNRSSLSLVEMIGSSLDSGILLGLTLRLRLLLGFLRRRLIANIGNIAARIRDMIWHRITELGVTRSAHKSISPDFARSRHKNQRT